MGKLKDFRMLVRNNRQRLIKAGFVETTVNSWIYTNRIPSYRNAVKLSGILKIELSKIPYFLTERVI